MTLSLADSGYTTRLDPGNKHKHELILVYQATNLTVFAETLAWEIFVEDKGAHPKTSRKPWLQQDVQGAQI